MLRRTRRSPQIPPPSRWRSSPPVRRPGTTSFSVRSASGRRSVPSDLALRPAKDRFYRGSCRATRASTWWPAARLRGSRSSTPEAVSSVDRGHRELRARRGRDWWCGAPDRRRIDRRADFGSRRASRSRRARRPIPARRRSRFRSCRARSPSRRAMRCSGVDDTKLVVRLDPRCASDVSSLRFSVGGRAADVLSTQTAAGASLVLLRAGRLESDDVAVVVTRTGQDGSVVGQTRARTRALPTPRVTLVLDDGRDIDFVPVENRARGALATCARRGGRRRARGAPSIEGAVRVARGDGAPMVRAETRSRTASGRAALRVSRPGPPGRACERRSRGADRGGAKANQRSERPGAGPREDAARGGCCARTTAGSRDSDSRRAKSERVPFASRDTCRLVLHREQIGEGMGTQKIVSSTSTSRASTAPRGPRPTSRRPSCSAPYRSPASSSSKAPLAASTGSLSAFSQAPDDDRNPTSGDATSAQWNYVTGTEHARLYATTAIPTGLYRVSDRDHSGIMTLDSRRG